MSYKVSFRDKTEVIVSTAAGDKLKEAIVSTVAPEHITLNGSLYRTSHIISITPTNIIDDVKPAPPSRQLEQKKYICGSHSVQYQVIKYASSKGEVSKLKSKQYRDKVRAALHKKYPNTYCDHYLDQHYCTESKSSVDVKAMVSSVFGT